MEKCLDAFNISKLTVINERVETSPEMRLKGNKISPKKHPCINHRILPELERINNRTQ